MSVATGTVAGVRSQVAAALATGSGLPAIDYPAAVDNIGEPTILVGIRTGVPSTVGCGDVVTCTVWVVGALTDPGPADDALDVALDLTLAALRDLATTHYTAWERGTYRDSNPAYEITVEVMT